MALPAVAGNTILASDLYGIAQPSGAQEHGKYYLEAGVYATNAFFSTYYRTSSQGSTPVSVSIDTADQAVAGCNAPSTALLTSFGFQVKTSATGAGTDARVGGNYTVSF
jgi:hypothetical protein